MDKMTVYLAGPITGQGYAETMYEFLQKKLVLEDYYRVLHPMLGKGELRNETKFRASDYVHVPVATNHAIVERDRWMVEQSDVVFADLGEATQVSIGTCFEMAWAAMLGRHTVVVLPEDGPHQHAFVLEAADVIFRTSVEAIAYLIDLAKS